MKAVVLTSAQQAEVATLQATITTAQAVAAPANAAVATAQKALQTYLATVAGITGSAGPGPGPFGPMGRRGLQLTTDGTAVVVMP